MARVSLVFDGSSRGAVAAARQTREGLAGVSREGKVAAGSLREVERDVGRASRGALAGSGVFRSFGRSVAFASGAFLGAAGFTAVIRDSITKAEHLDDVLDRSRVVFQGHAKEVQKWAGTTADSFGLARSEAIGFANEVGTRFRGLGIAGGLVASYSQKIVELSRDIGELQSKDPASFIEAFDAALAGRTRGLKQFGIFIDDDRLKAEALSEGLIKANVNMGDVATAQTKVAIAQAKLVDAQGKYAANSTQVAQAQLGLKAAEDGLSKSLAGKVGDLTDAQKATATYQLVLKQTADVQGFYAKQSGDADVQTARLRARLNNLEEDIGTALLPTVVKITSGIADWLSKSENQEKVTNAVTDTVDKLTVAVKVAWPEIQKIARQADAAAKAVGGWKDALLLLVGIKMLSKIGTLEEALAKVGKTWKINLALVGGAAIGLALVELQKKLDALTGDTQGGRTGRVALGTNGRVTIDAATGRLYGGDRGAQLPIPEAVAARELGVSIGQLHAMIAQALGDVKKTVDKATAAVTQGAVAALTSGLRGKGAAANTTGGGGPGQMAPIQSGIVTAAQSALGVPYQYGGLPSLTTPTDCSGLVVAVMAKNGITVPRTAEEQYQQAPIKNPAVLLPGDLVFYDTPHIGHVGIYVGNNTGIFDPHTGDHVKYESITGPGPVVATARWWDTATPIHGTPKKPATGGTGDAGRKTGADAGGVGDTLTVAHPPKKAKKAAAPSIQEQLDALFGIKETVAERTKRLSDDASVIAAELRWVDEQLAGKPSAADRLELERLKTDLLAKSKDIVKQEHDKQKALAAEFAAQQQAPGPTQPELERAATRPGRASELGAVGVAASRQVINQRLAADAAAARAAHDREIAEEDARWKRLEAAGAAGVKRYNDAIRAAAAAGVEMLKGVDLSKRLLAGLKELPRTAEITIGQDLFGRPIQESVTKVRARIADLVNIIQTGTKQAREAAIRELGQLAGAIGQAMSAANAAAQAHVEQLQGTFETAFGRVSDQLLTGFDRQTQSTVAGMQASVSAQIDAINRQTQQEIDQLNEQVSAKIDQLQRETQARVKQLQEAGQAATPAEAQLAGLQAQHDAQQAAQALTDAQKQLAEAKTPEERLAAQRQIDDLLYQQRIAALQKTAQAERAARDKQTQEQVDALQEQEQGQEKSLQKELSNRVQKLQDESAAQAAALQAQLAAQVQNFEDMRAAQRQWLADQLIAWQTNIENGTATMQDFITWLLGQGASGVLQGVDIGDPVAAMGNAGKQQGSAFADSFIDELNRAYRAYLDFLAAVANLPTPGGAGASGPQNQGDPVGISNSAGNGGGGGGGGRRGRRGGGGGTFAFASGGLVPGTYIGRQDTILARVTPGEEVIDRRDTARLSRLLDALEAGGGGGPAVVMNRPTFFGGTPRQVNQGVARAIEPHLGRLAKYKSPI